MNYTKFGLKILALLIVAQSGIVLPMNPNGGGNVPVVNQPVVEQPAFSDAELRQILADADEIVRNMQTEDILNAINPEKLINDIETEKQRKIVDKIKYQNTILFNYPRIPVALYRSDLVLGGGLIAKLGLAYWFTTKLYGCRVNHIYDEITENVDTVIDLITQAQKEQITLAEQELQKSTWQKLTQRFRKAENIKFQELNAYIDNTLAYIGYNPFKLPLLLPFAAYCIGNKVIQYSQEELLATDKAGLHNEYYYAYTQEADGTLTRHQYPFFPLSTMGIFQSLSPSGFANTMRKAIPLDIQDVIPFPVTMNGVFEHMQEGLPAKLEADAPRIFTCYEEVKNLLEIDAKNYNITQKTATILALGLEIKMMDMLYHARWRAHMLTKIDEFLELLHTYKATKSLPETNEDRRHSQTKLRLFIQEGNQISTLNACETWTTLKEVAFDKVTFWKSLPIWCLGIWVWRNDIQNVASQSKGALFSMLNYIKGTIIS